MIKQWLILLIAPLLIMSCGDDNEKKDPVTDLCDSCTEWQECSASGAACVAKDGRCDTHFDCSDETVNTICDTENHTCVEPVNFSCDLCKVWENCNETKKTCTLKENRCYKDEDCSGGAVCDTEIHTCQFDCNTCETWEQCNNEETACEAKPGSCSVQEDCGDWGNCNTTEHLCIPLEGRCANDENCNNNLVCKENHFCGNDEYVTTTINWLQESDLLLDQVVQITSTVTAVALSQSENQKGAYVQNGTEPYHGLYIYFNNAGAFDIKAGDQITATGTLDNQLGVRRLRTPFNTIVISKRDQTVPASVEIDYFTQSRAYESMLVSIKLDSRFNIIQVLPQHYVFGDDADKTILVKDTLDHELSYILSLDDKLVSLTGIIDHDELEFRVLPRDENDITLITPVCGTACSEWERCVDIDICVLDGDRCVEQSDCTKPGAVCNTEAHWCELPATMINGDLESWDDDTTPTGYMIGHALDVKQDTATLNSGSSAAWITQSQTPAETIESNILSPAIAVKGYKNYRLKASVLDKKESIKARMVYELYDIYNQKIGSGVPPSNDDFTYDSDVWQDLTFDTTFIAHMWGSSVTDDIASIRFGIRLYGTGSLHLDDLTIEEIEE